MQRAPSLSLDAVDEGSELPPPFSAAAYANHSCARTTLPSELLIRAHGFEPGSADDCTDRSVNIWECLAPLAHSTPALASTKRPLGVPRSSSGQGLDFVEC
jgi:hypothetical protein